MTAAVRGDGPLAARLGALLGARHPVAAATISPAGTVVASRGAELDGDYEIASISKGITGLLYADSLERGEIRPDTTLGELLPLDGAAAARVTLASLSTHGSGLPRLPRSMHPLRRTVDLWRHGTNPYREDLQQLFAHARAVAVGRPGARYSNLGFELLGHAVASAAGVTYAELVRRRVADPLGLDHFYVPATTDQLRRGALTGRSRRGRRRDPWTGEALGPAGGIRASIQSMARLAAALLDGSAPGTAALDPVHPFGRRTRIGAAWITTDIGRQSVTWHNGGSGGFRSWLGLDREAGGGVVILSATSASVDRHGFRLLAEQTGNRRR